MSNPWTKKNPLMSVWLSSSNKAMNATRGQVAGAAKRQVAAAQANAVRQVVDFWSGKTATKALAKKRRRR
ncbi:hypothetical protein [Variovorax sp. YR216]|uniref:hypothetical protein n=1 Tax=Variovorax sp. YR216 TaxID=1882828 RepID=UPI000898C24E|nr:hypothetical protein [Variovorax sp. YR216]SEB26412.1 hypothetical protein SAMN05444680_1325 [Variovorax sp. YR216]